MIHSTSKPSLSKRNACDRYRGDTIQITAGQGFKGFGGQNERGIRIDMIKNMKEGVKHILRRPRSTRMASLLGCVSLE